MASVGHIGCPKITLYHISYHFRSIPQFLFLWIFFTEWLPAISFDRISGHFRSIRNFCYKMAAGAHFGCSKFTFDRISGHFRSIRNSNFYGNFWQNGWRRPYWMSEIHFQSHFWPFQIDTQLIFFGNFWQNGWHRPFWMSEIHFRSHFWTFQIDRPFWISEIHFRSQFWPFQINTNFCKNFSAAILDVRKSLWIAFLTISDRLAILDVRWHFWPCQIHTELNYFCLIFDKMATGGHFGCPQITFDRFSGHFRSIRNFLF